MVLTNRCTVFIVHQNLRTIPGKPLYTYLATLGATFIGRRVRQGMSKIPGKASCTLTYVVKDTWYYNHRLQSSSRSVNNCRTTAGIQFSRIVVLQTILGKTPSLQEQAFAFSHIVILMST